jgi:hypothetical protein
MSEDTIDTIKALVGAIVAAPILYVLLVFVMSFGG